ncbi:MAG: VOC family protein [Solirubrobacterales bacterium]|nr:VOC family protein [Solirubrobacterales bacterium]
MDGRREDLLPLHRAVELPMTMHHQSHTAVDLLALDHVALSPQDPEAMARFLCEAIGLHELERAGGSIVVGTEDHATKVVLSASDGPSEPGALVRLILRVSDPQRALAALPPDTDVEEDVPGSLVLTGPEGLGIGLTFMAAGVPEYDLDDVVLRVADPEDIRVALAELGCVPRGHSLHVADKGISLEQGGGISERPLLRHVAVRVASVEAVATQGRERGLEIDESADGSIAIVLPGPERLRLSFVE